MKLSLACNSSQQVMRWMSNVAEIAPNSSESVLPLAVTWHAVISGGLPLPDASRSLTRTRNFSSATWASVIRNTVPTFFTPALMQRDARSVWVTGTQGEAGRESDTYNEIGLGEGYRFVIQAWDLTASEYCGVRVLRLHTVRINVDSDAPPCLKWNRILNFTCL